MSNAYKMSPPTIPSTITPSIPIWGDITNSGEVDWYQFTLATSNNVRIYTNNPDPLAIDTIVALWDPNTEDLIQQDDDISYDNLNSNIVTTLEAGTYYVSVAIYDNFALNGYEFDFSYPGLHILPTSEDDEDYYISDKFNFPESTAYRINLAVPEPSVVFVLALTLFAMGSYFLMRLRKE